MQAKIDMKAVVNGLDKTEKGAEKVVKRTVGGYEVKSPRVGVQGGT